MKSNANHTIQCAFNTYSLLEDINFEKQNLSKQFSNPKCPSETQDHEFVSKSFQK